MSGNDTATVSGNYRTYFKLSRSLSHSPMKRPVTLRIPRQQPARSSKITTLLHEQLRLNSVSNIDLRTVASAGLALKTLDGAIEKVSSQRAELGAIENRLNHTVSNLMNVAENTADSRSRINDADFSVESANLAKSQVLQQAGTAMLAQANARSQLVLQLLQ